tara:strand:- start:4555 stop:5547 length:993 start_codon:yes stop_codon:yes gene_type:complete
MSLKFGLIGCSKTALKNFLPIINSKDDIELDFIGSRSLAKAEKWAKENNCKNFGNYDDVINSDVDAIYLPLPIGLHEDWAIKAAKSGKHILCEKSSTTSYDSAKKIIDACKANNVRILEAFSFRFHPQHKKIQDLIVSEIGELHNFYGSFGFPSPSKDDIRWNKKLGGGVLNDAACYPICASRIIFDSNPISITANLDIDSEYKIDTKADIFLMFSNKKTAFISSGFSHYYQSKYSIWGSDAKITANRAYAVPKNLNTSIHLDKNDIISEIQIPKSDQFHIMFTEFCDVIRKQKTSLFNFEDELLEQARVLECARISHQEKRTVFLNELD